MAAAVLFSLGIGGGGGGGGGGGTCIGAFPFCAGIGGGGGIFDMSKLRGGGGGMWWTFAPEGL